MEINKHTRFDKKGLLQYFRSRAAEMLSETRQRLGVQQVKKQASEINKGLLSSGLSLLEIVLQKSAHEKWTREERLETVLMVNYTNYVVMLESRNDVWPYEYMSFSRRIGELWEPFCKLCFAYPINDLELFIPPTFHELKQSMMFEMDSFIDQLMISEKEKEQLKGYYHKVWSIVASGEIKLELDLHFQSNGTKYNVDFKSGFGSNEKGNANRLLLVASLYSNISENYQCLLFVRAEQNNHYFEILKKSGAWNTFTGDETYEKIKYFTGFDLKQWIANNVDWEHDFLPETYQFLTSNNLTQYLKW